MDLASAGLREQPFRTHGAPITTIPTSSYRAGFDVLQKERQTLTGVTLLQGPSLSGKTTLIQEFIKSIPQECAVAVVDGRGLDTTGLLQSLLGQFGYTLDSDSSGELLAMTRVFALQQAASHEPPVIIIESAHAMQPTTLHAICALSTLQVRQTCAIKLVLCSDRPLRELLIPPAMEIQGLRIVEDFHLRPMQKDEASAYLHAKLRAAGSKIPEFIFPNSVCNELWRASGGWPGIMDRVALLALAKADTLPVAARTIERPSLPQGTWQAPLPEETTTVRGDEFGNAGSDNDLPCLLVSHNGKLVQKLDFDRSRILIGRSDHNDLTLDSRFVSRHHMLLVRNGNTTFVMDLNSTNGTYINSKRVSNHVLIDDDVIAVGHHRIKFSDPHAKRRNDIATEDFAETAIMKTLDDMRALLSKENTELLPMNSENMPTIGNHS